MAATPEKVVELKTEVIPVKDGQLKPEEKSAMAATPEKVVELKTEVIPVKDGQVKPEEKSAVVATPEKVVELKTEVITRTYAQLRPDEESKVKALLIDIDEKYRVIPTRLKAVPDVQEKCLSYLIEAENILAKESLDRKDIVLARLAITRVNIQLTRSATSNASVIVVVAIIYIIGGLVVLANGQGWFKLLNPEDLTHQATALGIPLPIWLWSVIGSLTSMLLRAG